MKLKKFVKAAFTLAVVAVLLLDGILVLLPNLMGYQCFAVTSGSMAPAIETGSLVISQKVEPEEISEGDILTFTDRVNQKFFTHRVVKVDHENELLYTKGDANSYGDPTPTPFTYVQGEVRYVFKYLGYVRIFLSSTAGITVTLIGVAGWLLMEIYFVRKRANHEKA